MSSRFSYLCLSHEPAIESELYDEARRGETRDLDTALQLLPAQRVHHPTCDLILARYSGGLVELICPPSSEAGNPNHGPYHPNVPTQVDAAWLRLLWAACSHSTPREPALQRAVDSFARTCWTWGRVARLGNVLGMQERDQP